MAATRKKAASPAKERAFVDDAEDTRRAAARPDEMPADVLEFITAIDEYKRLHRRPFPTWSEVLEILKSLGYSRSH